MLQRSLNTNLVAWVVGVTIPLPMEPFSRHKDNRLDGALETCANSQVVKGFEVKAPTRHYSASVTTCSFFKLQYRTSHAKKKKKKTYDFTILTRVPVENLMQFLLRNDGDIRCVRLRGLTDVRGTHSNELTVSGVTR